MRFGTLLILLDSARTAMLLLSLLRTHAVSLEFSLPRCVVGGWAIHAVIWVFIFIWHTNHSCGLVITTRRGCLNVIITCVWLLNVVIT
jgi:hypothetical protein